MLVWGLGGGLCYNTGTICTCIFRLEWIYYECEIRHTLDCIWNDGWLIDWSIDRLIDWLIDWLIVWCSTPYRNIFQSYNDVNCYHIVTMLFWSFPGFTTLVVFHEHFYYTPVKSPHNIKQAGCTMLHYERRIGSCSEQKKNSI